MTRSQSDGEATSNASMKLESKIQNRVSSPHPNILVNTKIIFDSF